MSYHVITFPAREIIATFHTHPCFDACLQAKRLAWTLMERGGVYVVMDGGMENISMTPDEPWMVDEILQREG